MTNKSLFAFAAVSILHLIGCFFELNLLVIFSKPMLLLMLALYYHSATNQAHSNFRAILLVALLLSLIGDVLLLFASSSEKFFIFGLVAFLMAHLCYCLTFYQDIKSGPVAVTRLQLFGSIVPFLLIVLFAISLFRNVLGPLLVPVVVYMFVIGAMGVFAALRKNSVGKASYFLVLAGASSFIVSDFILAYNKFYASIPMAGFYIMLSYLIAQFCIVRGMLMNRQEARIK